MATGAFAVLICSRCFDLAPWRFLIEETGSVNAFRLTRRAADVGESARCLGMVLNEAAFPFLSLALSRRR